MRFIFAKIATRVYLTLQVYRDILEAKWKHSLVWSKEETFLKTSVANTLNAAAAARQFIRNRIYAIAVF